MPQVNCLGLSHHHAPVEVREQIKFTVENLRTLVSGDNNGGGPGRFAAIKEMVLLSTCNRISLYAYVDADKREARHLLFELMGEACRLTRHQAGCPVEDAFDPAQREVIENAIYHFAGEDAVRHLCKVACGLDSMVLGETQILAQIGDAYEQARIAGVVGPVLSAVFHSAQHAGKLARTETAISSNPASVSSVAVSMAQRHIGDLSDRDVLVVGIGEMGKLALRILHSHGAGSLRIANRTFAVAQALASHMQSHAQVKCVAHALEELPEVLTRTDAVITATAAMDWIVTADMMKDIMKKRNGRKLVLIDIAVPRDIEPVVGDIEGVHLLDGDDIKMERDEAFAARQREIPKVEAIIEEEITRLIASVRKLKAKPLITALRRKTETIRRKELERTYKLLGSPDDETWEQVQRFSEALINKLFHEPTTRITEEAARGDSDTYATTIRRLFGLTDAGRTRGSER